MTHPDDEILFQALDGELLDEARVAEVMSHAAGCARCTSLVDATRAMGGALRVWADELPLGDFDLADAVMAGVAASEPETPLRKLVAPVGDAAAHPGRPPSEARVFFLRRWFWPTLAAVAAAALLAIGHRPVHVKPPGAPMTVDSTAPAAAGASVARVEVVGAQSYAVLEVPGIQDGATTSVVWIQDDPEDPTPDESPMAVQ